MNNNRHKSKNIRPVIRILLTLEEKLSDEVLVTCFKELEPVTVRAYLKEAARILRDFTTIPSEEPFAISQKKAGSRLRQGKKKVKNLTLFSDGASRGNPGEAGAGILILDEQGREMYGRGAYLGRCTNNVAEYRALLMGIQEALRLGGEKIDIQLDSELIVRQIQGVYKVKNAKLKELFAEVTKELARFKAYSVAHIPREKNYRADQLANQAIDDKSLN